MYTGRRKERKEDFVHDYLVRDAEMRLDSVNEILLLGARRFQFLLATVILEHGYREFAQLEERSAQSSSSSSSSFACSPTRLFFAAASTSTSSSGLVFFALPGAVVLASAYA